MANFNINKVIVGGRLTRDIELKQTTSGVLVCSFSLAVNSKAGNQQKTDFLDCTAWRNTAEFLSKYFKKGSSLCIVGHLEKREWTDQNGQKRYQTEIVVDEALFVDSKNDSQGEETVAPTNYIPDAYKAPQTANFEAAGADTDADLPF